ncbi:uncharacterized protein B0H18DRAFT_451548 [Fomitopsis serialis]|uniref:uncharacterized protein n=1 Tax=Fomitopsis serialis TaxID=139415 RepID=UPI0020088C41|nr:uncharacterized protein B0H18DRAFT_451548 [Neoantrodia serialis]KAH9923883.1 hypothetical protein B0H18DRAFT_451548 [Neoantrodia serialis]
MTQAGGLSPVQKSTTRLPLSSRCRQCWPRHSRRLVDSRRLYFSSLRLQFALAIGPSPCIPTPDERTLLRCRSSLEERGVFLLLRTEPVDSVGRAPSVPRRSTRASSPHPPHAILRYAHRPYPSMSKARAGSLVRAGGK